MPKATVFLRKVSQSLRSRLGNEDATDEGVSSLLFGKSENDRSVYQAADELAEVDIATALLLTEGGNKAGDRLCLRLQPREVVAAQLTPEASSGRTGVEAVDRLHHDLRGTTEAVKNLVGSLREGYRRGEDRIRRVDEQQIVSCAIRFLEKSEMSQKAKHSCEAVIQRSGK